MAAAVVPPPIGSSICVRKEQSGRKLELGPVIKDAPFVSDPPLCQFWVTPTVDSLLKLFLNYYLSTKLNCWPNHGMVGPGNLSRNTVGWAGHVWGLTVGCQDTMCYATSSVFCFF